MEFKALETEEQLNEIKESPGYSVIFKHNTTCPISKNARSNFESKAGLLDEKTRVYILDLLEYRPISNAIAESFNVQHESPQVLLIKNGECTYHSSLYDISAEDIAREMK
jgi:bacillithiol system protein YtxJ